MNAEKLASLKKQVRVGGKGAPRRKKKAVHKQTGSNDTRIQQTLKRLGLNPIPGIEEVNFFTSEGTVLQFENPQVTAALSSNTFCIKGTPQTKKIADILPDVMSQLSGGSLEQLKKLAEQMKANGAEMPAMPGAQDDDDVPDLVDNFEEVSKAEAK